mgnify:CR=1 FL=1
MDVANLDYLQITNEGKLRILNFKKALEDSYIYVQANSGRNAPKWSTDQRYVGSLNISAPVINHPPTFTSLLQEAVFELSQENQNFEIKLPQTVD